MVGLAIARSLLRYTTELEGLVIDRRVKRTLDFLEQAWREPGDVAEIAARVGLSSSRLEHLFREHARSTIRDYLRDRRLLHAAAMLVDTDERVSQICYAVGFGDPSNFNHAFKKTFGVSPKQYRNGERAAESTNE
jgi:AraC-like DNA-binding protein